MVKFKGGGSQTENMLRAQEEGSKAVARGSDAVTNQYNQAAQAGAQGGMAAVQTAMQYRGQLANEDAQAQQQALAEKSQGENVNLQAAQMGLREKKLQEDMARGAEQTGKPLGLNKSTREFEVDPNSPITKQNQQEIAVRETNAAANYLNAQDNLAKATLGGDKEGEKAAKQSLAKPLEGTTRNLDKLMSPKSDLETGDLMSSLKSKYGDSPDPELQRELASGQPGPRVVAALREEQSQETLKYVAASGELPDSKEFDMSHPTMQRYFRSIETVNGLMKTFGGGQLASWAGIKSQAQKNTFTNKLAAWMVRQGMDQATAQPPGAAQQQGAQNAQPGNGSGGGAGPQQPPAAPGGAAQPPAAAAGPKQPSLISGVSAPAFGKRRFPAR